MAKLTEMNGWELSRALADLAEPVGNLVNDDEFWDAFKECTKRGVGLQQKNGLRFILKTYSDLFPLLMGERHIRDTFRILAITEGKTMEEVARMNGMELFTEMRNVFREQLQPFFTLSALSEMRE